MKTPEEILKKNEKIMDTNKVADELLAELNMYFVELLKNWDSSLVNFSYTFKEGYPDEVVKALKDKLYLTDWDCQFLQSAIALNVRFYGTTKKEHKLEGFTSCRQVGRESDHRNRYKEVFANSKTTISEYLDNYQGDITSIKIPLKYGYANGGEDSSVQEVKFYHKEYQNLKNFLKTNGWELCDIYNKLSREYYDDSHGHACVRATYWTMYFEIKPLEKHSSL